MMFAYTQLVVWSPVGFIVLGLLYLFADLVVMAALHRYRTRLPRVTPPPATGPLTLTLEPVPAEQVPVEQVPVEQVPVEEIPVEGTEPPEAPEEAPVELGHLFTTDAVLSAAGQTTDWGHRIQVAAQRHLDLVADAAWLQQEAGVDFDVETPAVATFCGCTRCVVREVIAGAWPVIHDMFTTHNPHDVELVRTSP